MLNTRDRFYLLVPLLLSLAACATSENYIVLLEGEDGKATGAVEISNEQGSRVLDVAGSSMGLEESPDTPAKEVDVSEIEKEFSDVLAAQPPKPVSYLLYFESGGAVLTQESQQLIGEIVQQIQSRTAPDIGVVGHTDTAGSEDVNARLALERAQSVLSVLISAGIDENLIEVTSHGENNPLIPTEDGVDEPRNRRVEVIVR